MENEFHSCRKNAIKAAKDFNYGDDVIDKLKAAKTISEVNRIMVDARHEKLKGKDDYIMKKLNPKKDCFAYIKRSKGEDDCKALNDLYCRYGDKCPFYKKAGEVKKGV